MLENLSLVAVQVAILYILIAVGFFSSKFSLINESGTGQLSNLLLFVITPCIIIRAFQMEFNRQLAVNLLIAAACGLAVHLILILLSGLFFKKQPDTRKGVLRFALIYSNCGYMCIPILEAVLGDLGVFYGTAYIAVFNIAHWTHGAMLMGGRKELSLKKAIVNPGVLSILVALPLFFGGIRIPFIPFEAVKMIAALNTPLAMIIIGNNIQRTDLKTALLDKSIYAASLLRLVCFPVFLFGIFWLLRVPRDVLLSNMIQCCAPVAGVTVMFATRFKQDAGLASKLVAVSTLFSILTMPIMISLGAL